VRSIGRLPRARTRLTRSPPPLLLPPVGGPDIPGFAVMAIVPVALVVASTQLTPFLVRGPWGRAAGGLLRN